MNEENFSLIDSHAHITDQKMIDDLQGVIKRAKENHISHIVNICCTQDSMEKSIPLMKKYPWIVSAGATSPHDVEKDGEKDFSYFEKMAKEKKLVAIGETGLDYYYMHSKKEIQKKYLSKYFSLAKKYNLPVILHCRDAFADLFAIAKEEYKDKEAILHCFTGTQQEAKEALALGFWISISGIVTYKKSTQLQELVKQIPLEKLLIETDSPYLAPQKYRGKRNEPSYLIETAKMIAELKGLTLQEIADVTAKNAKSLFFST